MSDRLTPRSPVLAQDRPEADCPPLAPLSRSESGRESSWTAPDEHHEELTRTLAACSGGDTGAFDRLIPLVYSDLRGIAHRRLRSERTGHTLDTTAVVHEAYLQLVNQATASWEDRAHFFAVASRVIRHVLIDYARRRGAAKRGGDRLQVPLRDDMESQQPRTVDLIALDEALSVLAEHDERMARVVECRFFGGMTMTETATAVGVSLRSVERDWTRARAHLYQMLSETSNDESSGGERD